MNRYLFSFLITLVLYIVLFGTYLYSKESKNNIQQSIQKSNQIVKFRVIRKDTRKPKALIKKVPKIVKKRKETKILKKLVTQKLKPQIKKTTIKEIKKEKIPQKKIVKNITKQIDIHQIRKEKLLKERYYTKIKERINRNKSYPRKALKRGIEGDVKVEFKISNTGKIISSKVIQGKKVFHKSIKKAINDSFPLLPPEGLFSQNITLTLTLRYILY